MSRIVYALKQDSRFNNNLATTNPDPDVVYGVFSTLTLANRTRQRLFPTVPRIEVVPLRVNGTNTDRDQVYLDLECLRRVMLEVDLDGCFDDKNRAISYFQNKYTAQTTDTTQWKDFRDEGADGLPCWRLFSTWDGKNVFWYVAVFSIDELVEGEGQVNGVS